MSRPCKQDGQDHLEDSDVGVKKKKTTKRQGMFEWHTIKIVLDWKHGSEMHVSHTWKKKKIVINFYTNERDITERRVQ